MSRSCLLYQQTDRPRAAPSTNASGEIESNSAMHYVEFKAAIQQHLKRKRQGATWVELRETLALIMRSCLAAILLLASSVCVFAVTDLTPHVSPDGRHAIHNIGDTAQAEHHFEIRTRAGEVLLRTDDQASQQWLPTHANDILWSADSQFVLLRYARGKLDCTALFSFADRKLIDLLHVDDGWTVPIRWVSKRTFIVEDSGPHGGKARGGGYHYRKTYRIRSQPLRLECVYTSPTITTQDDPEAYH